MADSTSSPTPDGSDGADLGHLDPGPAPWLEAALGEDVAVEPATMERHIAAAMGEFGRERDATAPIAPAIGATTSPSRGRWLAVAAAVVVTLGAAATIVGVVSSPSSDRVDSVADSGESAEQPTSAQADQDAAGDSREESLLAPGAATDDQTRAANDASGIAPSADLGDFDDDDALRVAIASGASTSGAAAGGSPSTAPAVPQAPPAQERSADAPTLACPPPDAIGAGATVVTATVGGNRVLAVVPPGADATRIAVYDAATCTLRPR